MGGLSTNLVGQQEPTTPPPRYQDLVNQNTFTSAPAYSDPYDTNNNNSAYPFQSPPSVPVIGQVGQEEIQQTYDGILSHDATLNTDSKALLDFFLRHCSPPGMSVNIRGTHTEHRTRTVRRNGHSHKESYTVTVTDFETILPVSMYIQPTGIIYNAPDSKGNVLTIPEQMQHYVDSKKKLKSISMNKNVIWNFGELTQVIEWAVRSTGYNDHVHVTFPIHNCTITVASNSALQKMSESSVVQCLCVISCLWIIFLPIYCMVRDKMDNTLRADFPMGISEQDWFNQNYLNIVMNVRHRSGMRF